MVEPSQKKIVIVLTMDRLRIEKISQHFDQVGRKAIAKKISMQKMSN
jgi:hypothetical protein